MHLLIDIGNTRTKYAACSNSRALSKPKLFESASVLNDYGSQFDSIVVSNVTSQKPEDLLQGLRYKNLFDVKVKSKQFNVTCGYDKVDNLGVDRWIGVLGAEHLFPNQNVIVIDAGTATTIDFLSHNKKHLGGWILPGLSLMQQSIVDRAPNVFSNDVVKDEFIGTDTPSALLNGCLMAQEGAVFKAIEMSERVFESGETKIVLTGGSANDLASNLVRPLYVEPNLLFHGLSRFC